MDNEANTSDFPVFKVPALAGKVNKFPKLTESSSKPAKNDVSNKQNSSSSLPLEERRPAVSFRTKSMTLPSEVYKPHRPSATEFLERHLKNKSNLKKEQDAKKIEESIKDVVVQKPEEEEEEEVECKEKVIDKPKLDNTDKGTAASPAQAPKTSSKPKPPPPKLNYTKPPWSISCDSTDKSYNLEVLRGGSIIDKIELTANEYFVFGRLPECDITLEHPSISRHHAILQFGIPTAEDQNVEFQKDGSAGFYLLELGSTHGTFLNKAKVPQGKYYRIKVGHMFKFGNSTRTYILQGPGDDEEMESEETATELRDKARDERNKKKQLEKMMMGEESDSDDENKDTEGSSKKNNEDSGISWGMLEEAFEEDIEAEESKTSKPPPDAIPLPEKDPFYVKDPHKALKNFYEKEGMELDFECNERRSGQWNVRLELPVDTPTGKPIFAEASVTGKRKEGINNCALEACRIMDRHGLFKRTERHRKKVKQWEKDDYYDSDEDQFLDRTGDLEVKRKQRKLRVEGKKALLQEKAETYESLNQQIKDLEKEVAEIENQLNKDKEAIRSKGGDDPLEEFMRQVKSGNTLDSLTRTKLKHRLIEARRESARLSKLAEIARPISLPPVNQNVTKSLTFIGKMKGRKRGFVLPPKPMTESFPVKTTVENDKVEVEEDEEAAEPAPPTNSRLVEIESAVTQPGDTEEPKDKNNVKSPPVAPKIIDQPEPVVEIHQQPNTELPEKIPDKLEEAKVTIPPPEETSQESAKRRTLGPTLPESLRVQLSGVEPDEEKAPDEEPETEEGEQRAKRRKRQRKPRERQTKDQKSTTISNDPDYCDWMPPQGQSGDGTTSLNAKFGY